MKSYLDLISRIVAEGKVKHSRAGDTIGLSGVFWEHHLSDGFPLLTVRHMPIKSILVELEGFIRGITSKRWFQERGCHFWDEWCNPRKLSAKVIAGPDKERKHAQLLEDDLGPLSYSFEVRRFGEAYDEDDDGVLTGLDQLAILSHTLKTNPNDRRMVVSGWNPLHLSRAALPGCLIAYNAVVYDGELNLNFFQRSADAMLGVPCDIASYATLLLLLSKDSGLKPGKISVLFNDLHIYQSHLDSGGVYTMLSREPFSLPELNIIAYQQPFSIFNWQHTDVELLNYQHHDKIHFKISV